MTELLFGVLLQGLKLWNSKESNKYMDEVLSLKKNWLAEYSKPRSKRNNSELDEIESQLCLIAKVFSSMGKEK